jgi:transposase
MKKTKLQGEYSRNGSFIQLCLPIETEVFIPVDDSVRLLDQLLEELDYSVLYRSYASSGRNPAIHPKNLFKVMVYAYSQGVYSSRKIEQACHLNLAYRYLLRHETVVPDHNTIARFRKERLSGCVEELLTQLVMLLHDYDEINFEHLFVDGTKIEANANKYTFVWKKATLKFEEKMQVKIRALVDRIAPSNNFPHPITWEMMEETLIELGEKIDQDGIVFVQGKGKRKTQLQRDYETLQGFMERQKKYDDYKPLFGNRNSFSKTDPDATFMHLKDDHMRNSQLKPAYNLQVAVESEYIVGVDLSSHRNDMGTLIPFLESLERNHGRRYRNLICDAGYESEENYTYLDQKEIKPFIKPSNYEYSKTRKFQQEMEFRLGMDYLPDLDAYRCKAGRLLTYRKDKQRVSATGFKSTSKVYECESCKDCIYLGKCYRGKYSKRIQVAETFDHYRAQSLSNITSEEGILLRVNRSIQAEGVFGVLKWNYGFQRFLTRGAVNVKTECLLLAFGFNINKLHHRIQNGRLGLALFPLKKAG